MNIKEEEEIKKEFQLERVILFSDAVFAIIITIMVLEIKLPEGLRHAERKEIKHALFELAPRLFGYVTAFFFVGMFWLKHLKTFSYLKDYSKGLIIWNLVFLFFISLFPFGVSVMTETLGPSNTIGIFIYFNVIAFSILGQTLLTRYLIMNAATLCIKPNQIETNLQWKVQRMNFVTLPLLFAYVASFVYYEVNTQFISFGFIVWALVMTRLRRKYYPGDTNDEPIIKRLFASRKRKPTITTPLAETVTE
nr:TMEM175 family protein [uncultured Mucilaginibacter sp.]